MALQGVGNDDEWCSNQDHEILTEAPCLHVAQVEFGVFAEVGVHSAVELPQASNALGHRFAQAQFIGEVGDFGRERRAGTHKAHGAKEDIDELGKFIEAGSSEDPSGESDPGIIIYLEQRSRAVVLALKRTYGRVSIFGHGSELDHREFATAVTNAGLAIEHRATVFEEDRHCDDQKDRRQNDEHRCRDDQVEESLYLQTQEHGELLMKFSSRSSTLTTLDNC